MFKLLLLLFAIKVMSTFAVEFTCLYRNSNWEYLDTVYNCEIFLVRNKELTEVLDITGTHTPGKTFENVEGIYLFDKIATKKIPSKIEIYFPNLKSIRWSLSNLESISAGDLEPLPDLEFLG